MRPSAKREVSVLPPNHRHLQRTYEAVRLQVEGMNQPLYELGIHRPHQRMLLRTWQSEHLLEAIPWLRHMNAAGDHIYIRPARSLGLVLLDDLDLSTIAQLRGDGLSPAVIVETSPGNFQCWIRLLHNREGRELCPNLIRRLLRHLAHHYGTDPASADWRHFGRLAGFTNRKSKHARAGKYPFVLLHYAQSIVAPLGRTQLLQVSHEHRRQPTRRLPTPTMSAATYPDRLARILAINHHQPWVSSPDYSRIDFMIAREMLAEGHSPDDVQRAILEGSPNLHVRKAGHVQDYVLRTVNAATGPLSSFPQPGRPANELHLSSS